MDLVECKNLGIPVLGTNEHHRDLRIFEYLGVVALKLLLEVGMEIFRSHVVVVGSGEFAHQVVATLIAAKARVTLLSTGRKGRLRTLKARQAFRDADAVVVVEHYNNRALIGQGGEIGADELFSLNPRIAITHICGGVDRESLSAVGINCHPSRFAVPGYMSVSTDYLGPRPVIDLHTAGLKIGEELSKARTRGLSGQDAERFVLAGTSLAQGFSKLLGRKERNDESCSPREDQLAL